MVCGIYQIKCIVSSRFYIGSAVNIYTRWTNHKRLLRQGKHYNKFLQAEWNKYGSTSFEFSVLEISEKDIRMECEQKWLNTLFDNQTQCYNMQPFAGTCRGRMVSKETRAKISKANLGKPNRAVAKTYNVILVSPLQETFGPITNIESFSKVHGLNSASVWKVIKGLQRTTKGWRLKETPDDSILLKLKGEKIRNSKAGVKRPDVFTRCARTYNVWLIDPEGEEHLLEKGLNAFARKHNLSISKLSLLIQQRRKTHKGWKLK